MSRSTLRGATTSTQSSRSGLTPDAMVVLDAVEFAGEMASAELGPRCSLSVERVGAAIGTLVQAGLLVVFRGERQQTWVRPVHTSMRGLLRARGGSVAPRAARQLLEARVGLEEILDPEADHPVGVERMSTKQQLQETLLALVERSSREVISVLAGEPPTPAELTASRDVDAVAGQRLKLRILYPMEYAVLDHVADYAAEFTSSGAEVRFTDRLPHRLLVFDRTTAVVPVDNDVLAYGALVVRESILASSLGHLAVTMFKRGRTLSEAQELAGKPVGPTLLERRVLMLMGSGMGDAACARRLSVTDRTFRRYVNALLSKLGASSRFDAGVKAVEQGWI